MLMRNGRYIIHLIRDRLRQYLAYYTYNDTLAAILIPNKKYYVINVPVINIYKYRCLQPQNLVLMGVFPTCDVKLCDFEISRVILEGTEIREILGTPDYVGE